MEITGKVIKVLPVDQYEKEVNGEKKVYYSQLTIIEVSDGRYTNKVCLKAFGQDKINACQTQVGDTIKASFDVSSHSFTDKNNKERWSSDLNSWKFESVQQQQLFQPQQPAYQPVTPQGYAPQAPQYAPQSQAPFPPQQPAFQPQQPQMPFPPQQPNPNDSIPF